MSRLEEHRREQLCILLLLLQRRHCGATISGLRQGRQIGEQISTLRHKTHDAEIDGYLSRRQHLLTVQD